MRRWNARLARGGAALPLSVLAALYALLVLPHASGYGMHVLSLAGIYALLALGYFFIFGLAGALSLAQGTFMGVGAYLSGILATRYGVDFASALPFSVGVPVLLAFLVAVPVLRLQTHYFALATVLIGQVGWLIATQWQGVTGGANGIAGVPGLYLFHWDLSDDAPTLVLIWTLVALGALLAWSLARGQLGDGFATLRAHRVAAQSIGLDGGMLRLGAFLFSAGYAGVAGSIYVHVVGVLSPDVLGFPIMVTCLTSAVVGGRNRVAGAVLGAVLVIELPEWVRFLQDDYMLVFGCILLLVIVVMPDGLTDAAERLLARVWQAPAPSLPASAPAQVDASAAGTTLLEAASVSRNFGGVRALADVSLSVRAGEVLGLIGPNGSGKTTLINAITGTFPPDGGTIAVVGHDIAGLDPHRIARLGVARSFQTAALVADMSALDNVAIAVVAKRMGFCRALAAGWRDGVRGAARATAMGWLERMGAADYALAPAASLPPGVARLVEIARALATRPRLLLLDEPAAGLNETEQAALALRLRAVAREGIGLLVIEHNMPFLVPLADRMICLDHGRAIADGTPQEVQSDPRVIEAYLGTPGKTPAPPRHHP